MLMGGRTGVHPYSEECGVWSFKFGGTPHSKLQTPSSKLLIACVSMLMGGRTRVRPYSEEWGVWSFKFGGTPHSKLQAPNC